MNENKKVKFSMVRFKIFLLINLFGLMMFISLEWSSYRRVFETKNIYVKGNLILDEKDCFKIIGELKDKKISKLSSKEISEKLENNAFIKAARISKQFPNSINIDIVERKPIAIINNKKQFLIDRESVILPNSDSFVENALIPMLSGFNPANDLYPEGKATFSIKVKEAIEILDFIQNNFSEFYDEISELTINKDDEFEIILSEQPTRVILGKKDIQMKINILKKFGKALGQRQLTDYQLLDMRYSKQLVAREWI